MSLARNVYLTLLLLVVAYNEARDYVCVTGRAKSDVDGVTYNGGNGDVVLLVYSHNGTKLKTMLFGTSAYDEGYAGMSAFYFPISVRYRCRK